MQPASSRNLLILLVVIVLGVIAYGVLNMPDHRTTGDKISDAYHDLQDRTPAQKLGDTIKENTDSSK